MTLFLAAFFPLRASECWAELRVLLNLRVGRGLKKVPGASLCFLAGHSQADLNRPDKVEAGRSLFRAVDTNEWTMDHIRLTGPSYLVCTVFKFF